MVEILECPADDYVSDSKIPRQRETPDKICRGVIDAFHFVMSQAVQKFLVDTLLPMLNAFLVEKSEDAYAPMQCCEYQ